jgi:hypothetical protein
MIHTFQSVTALMSLISAACMTDLKVRGERTHGPCQDFAQALTPHKKDPPIFESVEILSSPEHQQHARQKHNRAFITLPQL